MGTYVSPGIYLEEKDESTFVQTGSTLRPGIVIRAPWGPTNTIKEITNQAELFETFGIPANGNYVGLLGTKEFLRVGDLIKVVRAAASTDAIATKTYQDAVPANTLKVSALYAGEGGNHVALTISTGSDTKKQIDVYFYGKLKETYKGLAKATGADKNANYKTAINGISRYITITTDPTCDANTAEPANVSLSALAAGADSLPTDSELKGAVPTAGLQLFTADTIYVNILTCPDGAKLATDSAVANVSKELVAICEARLDCIALVDIPAGKSVVEAITFKQTTAAYNSTYAACYWSWVTINEASVAADVKFPGSVAALIAIAQSDALSYPWYAAAGYKRAVISVAKDVEYNPGQGSRDSLIGAQINPIIKETGIGVVVFGNSTTYTIASYLQSLNIRRLLLTSKKLIADLSKAFIFDPNDPITEDKFIAEANALFASIAARRGLTDFRVSSITTDLDRDNNRMQFQIKLKATRTAEVIVIGFQIVNQTAVFED